MGTHQRPLKVPPLFSSYSRNWIVKMQNELQLNYSLRIGKTQIEIGMEECL